MNAYVLGGLLGFLMGVPIGHYWSAIVDSIRADGVKSAVRKIDPRQAAVALVVVLGLVVSGQLYLDRRADDRAVDCQTDNNTTFLNAIKDRSELNESVREAQRTERALNYQLVEESLEVARSGKPSDREAGIARGEKYLEALREIDAKDEALGKRPLPTPKDCGEL